MFHQLVLRTYVMVSNIRYIIYNVLEHSQIIVVCKVEMSSLRKVTVNQGSRDRDGRPGTEADGGR